MSCCQRWQAQWLLYLRSYPHLTWKQTSLIPMAFTFEQTFLGLGSKACQDRLHQTCLGLLLHRHSLSYIFILSFSFKNIYIYIYIPTGVEKKSTLRLWLQFLGGRGGGRGGKRKISQSGSLILNPVLSDFGNIWWHLRLSWVVFLSDFEEKTLAWERMYRYRIPCIVMSRIPCIVLRPRQARA